MPTAKPNRPPLLFYTVALLIPVLFFALLEGGLRLVDYGTDMRLFVPAEQGRFNQPHLATNPMVAGRYFPAGYEAPRPPAEYFKQTKPDNGYRIFVMGGSTTAGWPYPNNVMFSRLLGQRLADIFPDRDIEVINTGIAAVNTFTLLDFMDEILTQQPDAILIYSGHNEFYGALGAGSTQNVGQKRGWIRAYLSLSRLKTFQLLRDLIARIQQLGGGDSDPSSRQTLMSQMVGDSRIPYDSPNYRNARDNYAANLDALLAQAEAAGVPVVLSELVSNVRDHAPFVSLNDGEQLPADLVFAWAGMLEQEGMHDMAREAYVWAKDLDALRFRATEEFNQIIHRVAARHEAPVVPMKRYFQQASRDGIVGKQLMLEHLHPNVDGYMLMAEAFLRTLQAEQFISPQWDPARVKPYGYYRNGWPITELDRALGEIRVINLTDHYPYPPKGPGERTLEDFTPRSKAEELALAVYKDELGYAEAHVQLAQFYESQNLPERAFGEYLALIRAAPASVDHYLMASDFLIRYKQFEQALSLLQSSLAVKETGYAHKWMGQILLIMQRPEAARPHLEAAMVDFPEDPQTIFNLGYVHVMADDIDGAQVVYNLLKRLAPESEQARNLEALIAEHGLADE